MRIVRHRVVGLEIVKRCPDCGAGMYAKSACCGFKKQGFTRMLKCLNAACKRMEGYRENQDEDRRD
jgi:hypothetical protein